MGVPKNLGVHTFADPVGHFGPPPAAILDFVGVAGGERVARRRYAGIFLYPKKNLKKDEVGNGECHWRCEEFETITSMIIPLFVTV